MHYNYLTCRRSELCSINTYTSAENYVIFPLISFSNVMHDPSHVPPATSVSKCNCRKLQPRSTRTRQTPPTTLYVIFYANLIYRTLFSDIY